MFLEAHEKDRVRFFTLFGDLGSETFGDILERSVKKYEDEMVIKGPILYGKKIDGRLSPRSQEIDAESFVYILSD